MGLLAEEFKGMTFFLQRIRFGVSRSVDFERIGLHFDRLPFALRLDKTAFDMDRRTGGNGTQIIVAETAHVKDNLKILNRRAVIKRNELHIFVASTGTNPSFYIDFRPYERGIENIDNFSPFHNG